MHTNVYRLLRREHAIFLNSISRILPYYILHYLVTLILYHFILFHVDGISLSQPKICPFFSEPFPSAFVTRCKLAMESISTIYKPAPDRNTALVIVTHAAGCIALTASAAEIDVKNVNAAAPCSVYRLTRPSGLTSSSWSIDNDVHGAKSHISCMGKTTWPWHFRGFIRDE